jgi:hypothetical protein
MLLLLLLLVLDPVLLEVEVIEEEESEEDPEPPVEVCWRADLSRPPNQRSTWAKPFRSTFKGRAVSGSWPCPRRDWALVATSRLQKRRQRTVRILE